MDNFRKGTEFKWLGNHQFKHKARLEFKPGSSDYQIARRFILYPFHEGSGGRQFPTPAWAGENAFNLHFVKLIEPSSIELEDFIHPLWAIEARVCCAASFIRSWDPARNNQQPSAIASSLPSRFRPAKTDFLQIQLSHRTGLPAMLTTVTHTFESPRILREADYQPASSAGQLQRRGSNDQSSRTS
jgi:hypothetical protein